MSNDPVIEGFGPGVSIEHMNSRKLGFAMPLFPTATVVTLILCLMAGCSSKCQSRDFEAWKQADHIVVKKMSKTTGKSISDRETISQIATFAEARKGSWGMPWAGTPVADVTLDFYSGQQFLGHLGVGKSFLEAQGCDDFVSRSLSKADLEEITRLAGISELLAK